MSSLREPGPSRPSLSGSLSAGTSSTTRLEAALEYEFQDPALLERALTHPSARSECGESNQRLEFLGDAVIGLVVAQFLFTSYPECDEGDLTRLRSRVVSTTALANWGKRLDLPSYVTLGRGMDRDSLPVSVLADAVEAVVGAAYLDSDLEAITRLVLWGLVEEIEQAVSEASGNFKSRLQELTQGRWQEAPSYEVVSEKGPDHEKEFEVAVVLRGKDLGRGRGRSKKLAAQAAARVAFERLEAKGSGPKESAGPRAEGSRA